MTFVKICGITRGEDAALACELGAGALGFNFYAKSKRRIEAASAKYIIAKLPAKVWRVGIFVNHTREAIQRIVDEARIDTLQFHGDETVEFCSQWSGLRVVKALRIGPGAPLRANSDYLAVAEYLLLDRFDSKEYGGTGTTIPDEALAPFVKAKLMNRVILAGGLSPTNVAERIQRFNPFGVDSASGVESAAGIKDPGLLRGLFRAIEK